MTPTSMNLFNIKNKLHYQFIQQGSLNFHLTLLFLIFRMLSAKKLIKMAKRWQKFAAIQRKRISLPRNNNDADNHSISSSSIAEKCHFEVYTTDRRGFVVPLTDLENKVIRQLLNMSKEEFGLPTDGPITLPCNSASVGYISLIEKGVADGDLHNTLLLSISSCCSSTYALHQDKGKQQLLFI